MPSFPDRPAQVAVHRRRLNRRGNVLIEFALVALLLYGLLSTMLTYGKLLWSVQVVQQATDLLGRELSRTPLDADITFENALNEQVVYEGIYNPNYLVIDISTWVAGGTGQSLLEWIDTTYPNMPVVNRALLPLMFKQVVPGAGGGGSITVFRYPGALIDITGAPPPSYDNAIHTGYIVEVPIVTGYDPETITWSSVVEEIDDANDPFRISSSATGTVAVRVHYPYQSAASMQWKEGLGVIPADDTAVVENGAPSGTPVDPAIVGDTHGGEFGLGTREALSTQVRPFRKLLATQAIYRREVFR